MNVVVNGKVRVVREGASVADLVETLGLVPRNVVVEHNGEPLERDRFAEVKLDREDVVEIVRAVPGG
jgi:thiamine biosynthesis protein ThiS